MDFGLFSDKGIPANLCGADVIKVNSLGYRCPEFNVPAGKKNVIILGCSHTFGVGHKEDTHWVSH